MQTLKILLHNSEAAYSSGNTVEGKLKFDNLEESEVKKVTINIYCVEDICCEEKTFKHVTSVLRSNIFDPVLGSVKVEPGENNIPFSVKLPHNLSNTYIDNNGNIRYMLEGVIELNNEDMIKTETYINIQSPLQIAYPSHLQEICTKKAHIDLGLVGIIEMEISVPKTFVLGSEVNFEVKISNNTFVSTKTVTARLFQKISYSLSLIQDCKFAHEKTLCMAKPLGFTSVAPHKSHTVMMKMKVPSDVVLPNFSSSILFSVDYLIEAECQTPWIKEKLIVYVDNILIVQTVEDNKSDMIPGNPNITSDFHNGSTSTPVADNIGFGAVIKSVPIISANAPLGFRECTNLPSAAPLPPTETHTVLQSLLHSHDNDPRNRDMTAHSEDVIVNIENLGFGAIYRNSPPVSSNTVSSAGSGSASHIPEMSHDDENSHNEETLRMSHYSSRESTL